jgi:hypothetical protein
VNNLLLLSQVIALAELFAVGRYGGLTDDPPHPPQRPDRPGIPTG